MYDEGDGKAIGIKTPGVGNDEFFDESAPLKANAARRPADETWGDLRSPDQTKLVGKGGQAKVTPADSRLGRGPRGNISLVDDNDLE